MAVTPPASWARARDGCARRSAHHCRGNQRNRSDDAAQLRESQTAASTRAPFWRQLPSERDRLQRPLCRDRELHHRNLGRPLDEIEGHKLARLVFLGDLDEQLVGPVGTAFFRKSTPLQCTLCT